MSKVNLSIKHKAKIVNTYFNEKTTSNYISKSFHKGHTIVSSCISKYKDNTVLNNPSKIKPSNTFNFEPFIPDIYQKLLDLHYNKEKPIYKKLHQEFINEHENQKVSITTFTHYTKELYLEMFNNNDYYLSLTHKTNEAQLDFGTCYYYNDSNKLTRTIYLVLSFPYSNTAYAEILEHRSIQHFIDSLEHIFIHIGYVPKEIWFDNDILFCFVKKGKRILNEVFEKAIKHFKFKTVFCSLRQGNEKGHVENHVRLIRENLFVPIPKIKSFCKYNQELLRRCDKYNSKKHQGFNNKTRLSVLKENTKSFLPLPKNKLLLNEYLIVKPNEIARITVKDKYYYLPIKYANNKHSIIRAKITMKKVNIFIDSRKTPIASFDRLFGDDHHSPIDDIGPYLKYIAKDLSLVFIMPFFINLPKAIQNYYLGISYQEKQSLIKNMSLVYNKTNDINFTFSVTISCIKDNLTSRYDFISKCKFMLIDPR